MTEHPEADRARRNTEAVLTAMRELFEEKDLTALDRYWAEPYVQHSPHMPSGLGALRAAVPDLRGFRWEPQRIAAQGDLVFTHSTSTAGRRAPSRSPTSSGWRTVVSSSTGTSSRTSSHPRRRSAATRWSDTGAGKGAA